MAERKRERVPQNRAIQTKATILRAAAEVFDEFGFSGASISKIMKRADVTQGGMYFHFASKEELAYAVMVGQGDGLVFPSGEDGLQRLVDITLYLADQLRHNPVLRAGVRLAVEQGSSVCATTSPTRPGSSSSASSCASPARRASSSRTSTTTSSPGSWSAPSPERRSSPRCPPGGPTSRSGSPPSGATSCRPSPPRRPAARCALRCRRRSPASSGPGPAVTSTTWVKPVRPARRVGNRAGSGGAPHLLRRGATRLPTPRREALVGVRGRHQRHVVVPAGEGTPLEVEEAELARQ